MHWYRVVRSFIVGWCAWYLCYHTRTGWKKGLRWKKTMCCMCGHKFYPNIDDGCETWRDFTGESGMCSKCRRIT